MSTGPYSLRPEKMSPGLSSPVTFPLVSIVTPSLNQGKFLEDTIRSVIEQDYPSIEYIVMDGGSQDETIEILRRYASQLAYWESQPDRGQANAINKGLRQAHGEILGWLNSDDVLTPGAVRQVVDGFRSHPEVGVIYGRLERIDYSGQILPTPELPKDRLTFGREYVIGECIVNQPGCLWRRSVMEQVGFLDENLRYSMDYDYWIRMALAGVRFLRLSHVLARFRLSRGSKTVGETAAMSLEQLEVLEKLLARPDLGEILEQDHAAIRQKADRARAVIGLHIGYGYFKQKQFPQALTWLGRSIRRHPVVLLDRRWRGLFWARMRRRQSP